MSVAYSLFFDKIIFATKFQSLQLIGLAVVIFFNIGGDEVVAALAHHGVACQRLCQLDQVVAFVAVHQANLVARDRQHGIRLGKVTDVKGPVLEN